MFGKKGNWWDAVLRGTEKSRDKQLEIFMVLMKCFKDDGYSKLETAHILNGLAINNPVAMSSLPLQLYWLEKYWGGNGKTNT